MLYVENMGNKNNCFFGGVGVGGGGYTAWKFDAGLGCKSFADVF